MCASQVLGGGIDVVTIGVRTYIRSVPGEFNMDKNKVMEVAQQQGFISAGAHWRKNYTCLFCLPLLHMQPGPPAALYAAGRHVSQLIWHPGLLDQGSL